MLFMMSSDGWHVSDFLNNTDAINNTGQLINEMTVLTLILSITRYVAIGFGIAFIIRLILFFISSRRVDLLKSKMDELNKSLRRMKRRDDVDKNDIEDLKDDVDDAYSAYQGELHKKYQHKSKFVLVIIVALFVWIVPMIIVTVLAASYTKDYLDLSSGGGAMTLNDLGTGLSDSDDDNSRYVGLYVAKGSWMGSAIYAGQSKEDRMTDASIILREDGTCQYPLMYEGLKFNGTYTVEGNILTINGESGEDFDGDMTHSTMTAEIFDDGLMWSNVYFEKTN